MPSFGKKKSNLSKVNEKDFGKMIQDLKEYKSLKNVIGSAHAKGTIKATWVKFSSFGGGKSIEIDKAAYKPMLAALLKHELNCVLTGHYYIGNLFNMCKAKCFSRNYFNEIMTPRDFGANDRDPEVDKAAAYLIFTSNSLRNTADNNGPITRVGIKNALTTARGSDIRKEATLRALHQGVVDQATLKDSRGPNPEAPYPSTGGAGFLLERTFGFVQGVPLPPEGDVAWFDLACFLLGATIRSHGFTDGNGRIGRAAYAVALLKGQLPFNALKVSAEKIMHGLDKVN